MMSKKHEAVLSDHGTDTPATEADFDSYVSPGLRGVWTFGDIVWVVAEHLGRDVDEALWDHVDMVVTSVVDSLGEWRCAAGVRFARWRSVRDDAGRRVSREALHEALYVPAAAYLITVNAVRLWSEPGEG